MDQLIKFGFKILHRYPTVDIYEKNNIMIRLNHNFDIISAGDSFYTNLSIQPKGKHISLNIFDLYNFLNLINKNLITPNTIIYKGCSDLDHLYRNKDIQFKINYEPTCDEQLSEPPALIYNHLFIKIRNGRAIDTYYMDITDFEKINIIISMYPLIFKQ